MITTITGITKEDYTGINESPRNSFIERMAKYERKVSDFDDSNYNQENFIANSTVANIFEYKKNENFKNIGYPQKNLSGLLNGNDKASFYIRPQKWIGHIFELHDNFFLGKLNDLNNPTTQEIIEIDLQDVSEEDKSLVRLGAAFYLSIGLSSDRNGQRKKEIILRFQRSKKWDADDLENILSEVDNQLKEFDNWV